MINPSLNMITPPIASGAWRRTEKGFDVGGAVWLDDEAEDAAAGGRRQRPVKPMESVVVNFFLDFWV